MSHPSPGAIGGLRPINILLIFVFLMLSHSLGCASEPEDSLQQFFSGDLSEEDLLYPHAEGLTDLNPVRRQQAAASLRRILDRALEAERTGEVRWTSTLYLNAPWQHRARELRKNLPRYLPDKLSPSALPLARYYLDEEPTAAWQQYGVQILASIQGPKADRAILDLIEAPHPNSFVVRQALDLSTKRSLRPDTGRLRELAASYRPAVAEMARTVCQHWQIPVRASPDQLESARSPAVLRILAQMDTLLFEHPKSDDQFVRVESALEYVDGDTSQWITYGWLRGEDDRSFTVLTPYTREMVLGRSDTTRKESGEIISTQWGRWSPLTLDEAADSLASRGWSSMDVQDDPDLYRAVLSWWLHRVGRQDLFARMFLPLLDKFAMDDSLVEHVRQVVGLLVGYRMLVSFVGERDYGRTEELAQLIRLRYPDTYFRDVARNLLEELPRRRDDFKTFTLPSAEEWRDLQAKLPREDQIRYLCERLRLMNCWQWGQPGGMTCSFPQHAEPEGMTPDAAWCLDQGRTEVVNPWVALTGEQRYGAAQGESLGLTISDIPTIASFLLEDWYILGVEFWRDFRAERTLHRRSMLISALINGLAGEEICDEDRIHCASTEEREAEVARIVAWARENQDRTEEELTIDRLHRAQTWYEVERLLPVLISAKRSDTVPFLLSFLDSSQTNDFNRESILAACGQLDGAASLDAATRYLTYRESPGVQIAAGIIVFRYGDAEAGAGAIGTALSIGTYSTLSPSRAGDGLRLLLSTGRQDHYLTCRVVLSRNYMTEAWPDEQAKLLRAFVSAGKPDAYEWLQAGLVDTSAAGSTYSRREVKLQRRDRVAALIVDLAPRSAGFSYDVFDPPEVREKNLAKFDGWLRSQIEALRRD